MYFSIVNPSEFETTMQSDNTQRQIEIVDLLKTGLFHHSFQRFLIRMDANRLGQITITGLIPGDDFSDARNDFYE